MAAAYPEPIQQLASPTWVSQSGPQDTLRVTFHLTRCGGKKGPRLEVREERGALKLNVLWAVKSGTCWVPCTRGNISFSWIVNRDVFLEILQRFVLCILSEPIKLQKISSCSDAARSQLWRLAASSLCWEFFQKAVCHGNARWDGLQQRQMDMGSHQTRPEGFFLTLVPLRATWNHSWVNQQTHSGLVAPPVRAQLGENWGKMFGRKHRMSGRAAHRVPTMSDQSVPWWQPGQCWDPASPISRGHNDFGAEKLGLCRWICQGRCFFRELNIHPWQKHSKRDGRVTRLRLVRSTEGTSPDFGAGKQSPCGLEMQGMTEKHLWLPKSSFHHLSAHFANILTTFVPVHSLVEAGGEGTQLSAPCGSSHLLPRAKPTCLCPRNPNKHFHGRLLAERVSGDISSRHPPLAGSEDVV